MTTMWRYIARPARGGEQRRGEIASISALEARSALRRMGLRVVDLRPARRGLWRSWRLPEAALEHVRRRRGGRKAEMMDSLATMLESGLPVLQAVGTLLSSAPSRSSRLMLARLQEDLRGGRALSEAMRAQKNWFDEIEVAMLASGEHSGELAMVLRELAARHERSGELASKLFAALAYPAVVLCVGLGVVVFLSTKTLPQICAVLEQARVKVPPLTTFVMGLGQALAGGWMFLIPALAIAVLGVYMALRSAAGKRAGIIQRITPTALRQARLAQLASGMAELSRSGVPLGEALRVLAPTFGGVLGASLRRGVEEAASRLEAGHDLASSLHDPFWFDAEFRQLLAAGEASGELEALLGRLAKRYARSATRAIDRLAALLEPAVILLLATLIGVVVMAAILPMLRLQEVIR